MARGFAGNESPKFPSISISISVSIPPSSFHLLAPYQPHLLSTPSQRITIAYFASLYAFTLAGLIGCLQLLHRPANRYVTPLIQNAIILFNIFLLEALESERVAPSPTLLFLTTIGTLETIGFHSLVRDTEQTT